VTAHGDTYICVLTQGDECAVCGGWLHTTQRGGFESPVGRICHPDEFDDAEDMAARFTPRDDWCPACGYDNHEHAPGCETRPQ
jgi:hypothetical protein